ncbi:Roadblock/LAMTOR2 domain [Trypanosoma melophagium]|uniref:Roadblock/LAMTOR2 domain n=1 Tax=Trypanosoma melophagium TaxID=715481 RepID=UPI003519DE73|nr:Roadblock/LAMTOR2 domain [Trypanosoma melophagium]
MAAGRVESVLELLTYTKGVSGVVVCNREGDPIRDSFQDLDRSVAVQYADMAANLARDAAPLFAADDSLDLFRVRSRTNEIIIKCHEEFLLVVIQEVTE